MDTKRHVNTRLRTETSDGQLTGSHRSSGQMSDGQMSQWSNGGGQMSWTGLAWVRMTGRLLVLTRFASQLVWDNAGHTDGPGRWRVLWA